MPADVITWAAAGAGIIMLIAIVRFWSETTDKIGAAKAAADTARADAAALKSRVDSNDVQIMAMNAAFSLHREQVARDYINRDTLREAETRITQAIDRLGDRLDRVFEVKPNN